MVRVSSGPSRGWIVLLSGWRPLLRRRLPPTTLSQTVQTLGFKAVLALAWFPHVLGESAAGGHGCWSRKAACWVSGQETPP